MVLLSVMARPSTSFPSLAMCIQCEFLSLSVSLQHDSYRCSLLFSTPSLYKYIYIVHSVEFAFAPTVARATRICIHWTLSFSFSFSHMHTRTQIIFSLCLTLFIPFSLSILSFVKRESRTRDNPLTGVHSLFDGIFMGTRVIFSHECAYDIKREKEKKRDMW